LKLHFAEFDKKILQSQLKEMSKQIENERFAHEQTIKISEKLMKDRGKTHEKCKELLKENKMLVKQLQKLKLKAGKSSKKGLPPIINESSLEEAKEVLVDQAPEEPKPLADLPDSFEEFVRSLD
jgi:hypothetical protein